MVFYKVGRRPGDRGDTAVVTCYRFTISLAGARLKTQIGGASHPPSQETPYLCGEECFRHPLRRDVALNARRMTMPQPLAKAGHVMGITGYSWGSIYRVNKKFPLFPGGVSFFYVDVFKTAFYHKFILFDNDYHNL